MIGPGAIAADALVAVVALLGGHLAGSIPFEARMRRRPGPGWALLAAIGGAATGVVPVAVGIATWSWEAGWWAGLGAVLGACWPMFGRKPGGTGIAVLCGAVLMLAPTAGVLALVLALVSLLTGRLLGRDVREGAVGVWLVAVPLLELLSGGDPTRAAGILVLVAVVAVRRYTSQRR